MAARMLIIAITIISSIKVKPFVLVFFNILGLLCQHYWLFPKLLDDIDAHGTSAIMYNTGITY